MKEQTSHGILGGRQIPKSSSQKYPQPAAASRELRFNPPIHTNTAELISVLGSQQPDEVRRSSTCDAVSGEMTGQPGRPQSD